MPNHASDRASLPLNGLTPGPRKAIDPPERVEGMSDSATEWTVLHFSQSNPAGEGQGNVAALLRRVADSVEELGDVKVQDVTFSSTVTDGEDDLTMTVYYHRPRRR